MSESLKTFRTSRKTRRCGAWGCGGTIRPGQRYLRSALPPNSDIGNVGWWAMDVCQDCMTPEEMNSGE